MLYKKVVLLSVSSVVVTVVFSMSLVYAQGNTTAIIHEDNQTGFTTYNDDDIGFSLNYPSAWTIDSTQHQYSTVVAFDSPGKEVSVDVRIFPKGIYKSIKEYGDKEFKSNDNDYTLLQYYRNSTTTLGGKPAFRAIYLTTSNPGLIGQALGQVSTTSKAMMVATLVTEKKSIFAIAYFADSSNFYEFLPTVDEIIKSFHIGNKTPIIQEED